MTRENEMRRAGAVRQKQVFAATVFKIAEVLLRIGVTYIVYLAVLRTAETIQYRDQPLPVIAAVALITLPILMAWQSKHLAVSIVDIVRKPFFESR